MNQNKKFFLLALLLIPGSMFGMLSKASRLTQLTKKLRFNSPNLRKNAQRFLATRRKNRTNILFNAPGGHYKVMQRSLPALIQKRLLRNRVPNDQVVKNNAQGIQKFLVTRYQPRANALIATQDNYKQITKNMLPILLQKRLISNNSRGGNDLEANILTAGILVGGISLHMWFVFSLIEYLDSNHFSDPVIIALCVGAGVAPYILLAFAGDSK